MSIQYQIEHNRMEIQNIQEYLNTMDEPGVDLAHVPALLHRDDPQVVLLTNPHQELSSKIIRFKGAY